MKKTTKFLIIFLCFVMSFSISSLAAVIGYKQTEKLLEQQLINEHSHVRKEVVKRWNDGESLKQLIARSETIENARYYTNHDFFKKLPKKVKKELKHDLKKNIAYEILVKKKKQTVVYQYVPLKKGTLVIVYDGEEYQNLLQDAKVHLLLNFVYVLATTLLVTGVASLYIKLLTKKEKE